jgi:hypothetical protein
MRSSSSTNSATALSRLCALAVALLALALAGCGGDDEPDVPERPGGITNQQGGSVKPGTTKEQLAKRFGEEPILTTGPVKGFPEGCVYYAMREMPLANVWQYCFDEKGGVALAVTQLAATQPGPPQDASPTREALLARADTICQSEYDKLDKITKEVTTALTLYSDDASKKNGELVGKAISDFIANLENTHETLSAFEAPEDGFETLAAYLDALQQQIDVLTEAREAFLDEDLKTYNELGDEFTEIGENATELAKEYGFAYCSAPSFG